MACTAFQITPEDIEQVLRDYSLHVINAKGQSFAALAEELNDEIDAERIERAALKAGIDLDEQTSGALEEIKQILVELGVLEF